MLQAGRSEMKRPHPAADRFSLECDGDPEPGNFILRAVCYARDWTLGSGKDQEDPRRLPGGGHTCAILAMDSKRFREE